MTRDDEDQDRVDRQLARLPEREYAVYVLGRGLILSLLQADIQRTPEDLAYGREVARRIYEAAPPQRQEQFRAWFAPGGLLLSLWSD